MNLHFPLLSKHESMLRIWLHAMHDLLHVFPLASARWTCWDPSIWRDPSWIWKIEIRKRIIPIKEVQRKSQQQAMWKFAFLLPAFINLFPTPEILPSWIFAMTSCACAVTRFLVADFPGCARKNYGEMDLGGGNPKQTARASNKYIQPTHLLTGVL